MATLKTVNKFIQEKYPLIELVQGRGYVYVSSSDDAMLLKISGLYTSSIMVCKISHATKEQWLSMTEEVLRDSQASTYDKHPII